MDTIDVPSTEGDWTVKAPEHCGVGAAWRGTRTRWQSRWELTTVRWQCRHCPSELEVRYTTLSEPVPGQERPASSAAQAQAPTFDGVRGW